MYSKVKSHTELTIQHLIINHNDGFESQFEREKKKTTTPELLNDLIHVRQ